MNVDELYTTTIKPLTTADRLTLARLILDDLALDQSAANALVDGLVLEALGSGNDPLTDAYKEDLRRDVLVYAQDRSGNL